MTEFNKIIRYLFPVFIYFGYTFIFLSLILLPEYFFYELVDELSIDYTTFLAFAGGIGFIISLIHHYFFWNLPLYPKTKYRHFIKILRCSGLLLIKSDRKSLTHSYRDYIEDSNLKGRKFKCQIISKKRRKLGEMDYWRILNIIWHRLRNEDTSFEKINNRNDSLTDLMHANGSSFVALNLGALTAFSYTFYFNYYIYPINIKNNTFFYITITLYILSFILHFKSYKFTVQNLNRFVEDALFHALAIRTKSLDKNKSKKNPLIFYIQRTDLSD
jgi:hypothetical protein